MANRPAGRDRREQILRYLSEYEAVHGYGPTRKELLEMLSMSDTNLRWHLDELRDQGFVTWTDGRMFHTLRLTHRDLAFLE